MKYGFYLLYDLHFVIYCHRLYDINIACKQINDELWIFVTHEKQSIILQPLQLLCNSRIFSIISEKFSNPNKYLSSDINTIIY